MEKTKKRQPRTGLQSRRIPIKDVSGNFPNLHHEIGTGKSADGRPMRFLIHINMSAFWLCVGDEMYQVRTEDLMNAVAAEVV